MTSDHCKIDDRWIKNRGFIITIFKELVNTDIFCEIVGTKIVYHAIKELINEFPQLLTEIWQNNTLGRTQFPFRDETALSFVVERKSTELTQFLIESGVDVWTHTISNIPDFNNPAKQIVLNKREYLILNKCI